LPANSKAETNCQHEVNFDLKFTQKTEDKVDLVSTVWSKTGLKW